MRLLLCLAMGHDEETTMKTLIKALMITALLSTTALAEVDEVPTTEIAAVTVQTVATATHSPATADQMAGIWHSMNWAQTETARVNVIAAVAKSYWLSVMQVEVLLETIASPTNRQRLLTDLYPRITNPDQISRLGRLLPAGTVPQGMAAIKKASAVSHL